MSSLPDFASFWGPAVTLITGVVASWAVFRTNKNNDSAQLRADMMKMIQAFQAEVQTLRIRIIELESQVSEKNKILAQHELGLIKLKSFILTKHNIDIDRLLKEAADNVISLKG